MASHPLPLIKIIYFLCTVTSSTLKCLKTTAGDYGLKYMVIIIPTNGGEARGQGSFCRGQNCTSNLSNWLHLSARHFFSVVYGFNGPLWPTFMAAVDECKLTPNFTATPSLLLNQLSPPVRATACEMDVNEPFLTATLQLLRPWEHSRTET